MYVTVHSERNWQWMYWDTVATNDQLINLDSQYLQQPARLESVL